MKIRKEVKIGFFATLMILLLYWGINFLRQRDIFGTMHTYYATYDQINGLQASSAIMIKGYKVGAIKRMSFDPEKSNLIVVELNIKSKFKIPDNSRAKIFSDGLMGGKAIEIELGDSQHYLSKGDTLHSFRDKDLFEMAGSEFESIKQRANQLMNEVMTTLTTVNALLLDNSANVNATMGNLAAITGSLRDVMSSESNEMRSIIRNMNALSTTLKNNASNIDHIMVNIDGFTDSLRRSQIPSAVNNLNLSLAQLNTTMSKINKGEGSMGKLVNDNGLYDSLTLASGNLARLLEDLKAHPGRYVQISVFGRKDKDEKEAERKAKEAERKEQEKATK